MDNYKLTYFNLRGIVEPIRLLLKYANVPFEDNQVDCTQWNNIKKHFKWQQLPFLEYNGKTLTQSAAIGNFLARKFNLVPEDPWDQAKCDEVIGAVTDLRLQIKPCIIAKFEGKTERADEIRQQLLTSSVPLFFKNLNELLEDVAKSSNSRTDFILGGTKPTLADFWLAHYTEAWTVVLEKSDLLENYTFLKKQQNAVYALPGVAEWIARRPDTSI